MDVLGIRLAQNQLMLCLLSFTHAQTAGLHTLRRTTRCLITVCSILLKRSCMRAEMVWREALATASMCCCFHMADRSVRQNRRPDAERPAEDLILHEKLL